MDRRIAGDGSSPSRPTILPKWKRTKLWQRLRKLDKKCGELKYLLSINSIVYGGDKNYVKMIDDFKKYDAKRKEIRNKLKGY